MSKERREIRRQEKKDGETKKRNKEQKRKNENKYLTLKREIKG